MKKALSIILAVAMIATMSISVLAVDFVGSIEAKTAPEVVKMKYGNKSYGALIVDSQTGEIKEGITLYDKNAGNTLLELYIGSVAEKSEAPLKEVSDSLTNAQQQIKNADNIGKLSAGLETKINNKIAEFFGNSSDKADISDLVVSDLFDVSIIRNKEILEQLENNQKITFTIKPSFTKNDFFMLLHNTSGTNWEVVNDVEWTEDGNLKVSVDSLSAFALVVEKNADLPVDPDGPTSPQTNNRDNFKFLYIGLAVICVGASAFFIIKAKKSRKAK